MAGIVRNVGMEFAILNRFCYVSNFFKWRRVNMKFEIFQFFLKPWVIFTAIQMIINLLILRAVFHHARQRSSFASPAMKRIRYVLPQLILSHIVWHVAIALSINVGHFLLSAFLLKDAIPADAVGMIIIGVVMVGGIGVLFVYWRATLPYLRVYYYFVVGDSSAASSVPSGATIWSKKSEEV